jgi:hypothetical protein
MVVDGTYTRNGSKVKLFLPTPSCDSRSPSSTCCQPSTPAAWYLPVHGSRGGGYIGLVEYLADGGADVNGTDELGDTPSLSRGRFRASGRG